jgi:hypothetical protein
MNEFNMRQCLLIEATILQYLQGLIDLHALVNKLDAIRGVLADFKWSEALFEPIFDLERFNSELISAKRGVNSAEAEKVNHILASIQVLVSQQKSGDGADS